MTATTEPGWAVLALDVIAEPDTRTETARAMGPDVAASLDALTIGDRTTLTTSVHGVDRVTSTRAYVLSSGSCVVSLSTGADDVDLYARDPRVLAAILTRAAAALLDAAADAPAAVAR